MSGWDAVTQIVGTVVIIAAVIGTVVMLGYQWQDARRRHRMAKRDEAAALLRARAVTSPPALHVVGQR